MNAGIIVLLLLAVLVGVLIVIGREYEERNPQACDFSSDKTPSTLVQQLRVGAFLAMDYGSDMVWPGSRNQAIALKRMRQTKEELRNGSRTA